MWTGRNTGPMNWSSGGRSDNFRGRPHQTPRPGDGRPFRSVFREPPIRGAGVLGGCVIPSSNFRNGQSPLIRTVIGTYYQRKKVVELFLQFGVDTSLKDGEGFTALERANQTRQKSIANLLQKHEPNLFELNLKATTRHPSETASGKPALSSHRPINLKEKVMVRRPKDTLISPLEELQGMVGLTQVKAELNQTINFLCVQRLRKQKGFSVPEQNRHFVFHGNPGTGKTAVANLTSRVYKDLSILDKGHLIKTDRAGLIAAYLTERLIRLVQSAIGGVLYI